MTTYSTGNVLETVSDLFIFKKFEQCLNMCHSNLEKITKSLEIERNAALSEGLCLIAIQAYAELNRWTEVLPFVTQIYNGIEDCPATVAQACVLLHARMRDYATCSAVTNIWLRNQPNFRHPEYHILLELYIGKVLMLQNRWSDMGAFVEACPGLGSDVKEQYKKQIKSLERRKEMSELDKITEIATDSAIQEDKLASNRLQRPAADEKSVSDTKTRDPLFLSYVSRVSEWVRRCVPMTSLSWLRNLALLAVLLYVMLTRANFDPLSREGWCAAWLLLTRLWKSMFAPFHLVKST